MLQQRFSCHVNHHKQTELMVSPRRYAAFAHARPTRRSRAAAAVYGASSLDPSAASTSSNSSTTTATTSSACSNSSNNKRPSLNTDNPLALAFLGDAIWTLYVRRHYFYPPKHYSLYHAAVRPYVTAEGQAAVYDFLLLRKQLTHEEVAFLRRVRAWENVKLRKRFASPAAADTYRKATALEALVGHLHLHDPPRLEALVAAALPPPSSPMQQTQQHLDNSTT